MEIYELNEDEKLILELLEGNLDEESRQVAFQKLAYNPNLQEDFLDYISIDKAIDFDANQVTVPIEYTNEIWNNIFKQHNYAEKKALELGLGPKERPWEGAALFFGLRSQEIFKIWEN
mgnify:CR=1 FL=1